MSTGTVHRVCLTGRLTLDGRELTSPRAFELLYLLAHEGPEVPKAVIEQRLYGGFCSRSAVWNIMKNCRDMGVSLDYDRVRRLVRLRDAVVFDVDIAMHYFSAGDFRTALWVVEGWPLLRATGSYGEAIMRKFRRSIEEGPLGSVRDDLMKIHHLLETRSVVPE
jgi:hypothetical protein